MISMKSTQSYNAFIFDTNQITDINLQYDINSQISQYLKFKNTTFTMISIMINSFHFFSNIFRGYRKKLVAWNRLSSGEIDSR